MKLSFKRLPKISKKSQPLVILGGVVILAIGVTGLVYGYTALNKPNNPNLTQTITPSTSPALLAMTSPTPTPKTTASPSPSPKPSIKPTPKPSPTPSPSPEPSPTKIVDLDISRVSVQMASDSRITGTSRGGNSKIAYTPYGPPVISADIINTGDIESKNVTLKVYYNDQEIEKRSWDVFETNQWKYERYLGHNGGTVKVKFVLEGSGPEPRLDNNVYEFSYTVE